MVKIEERELDVGDEDRCVRAVGNQTRVRLGCRAIGPDVQLELECDRVDAVVAVFFPVHVDRSKAFVLVEPVPLGGLQIQVSARKERATSAWAGV